MDELPVGREKSKKKVSRERMEKNGGGCRSDDGCVDWKDVSEGSGLGFVAAPPSPLPSAPSLLPSPTINVNQVLDNPT